MKLCVVSGRLFCYFPADFWQFVTTQGGRAPHRGHQGGRLLEQKTGFPNCRWYPPSTQHAATQDRPSRKPCETPPSIATPMAAKSPAGLTKGRLLQSHCARSHRLAQNDLLLICGEPLQTVMPERPSHNRGHPSGDGKHGDTSRIVSAATFNQSH